MRFAIELKPRPYQAFPVTYGAILTAAVILGAGCNSKPASDPNATSSSASHHDATPASSSNQTASQPSSSAASPSADVNSPANTDRSASGSHDANDVASPLHVSHPSAESYFSDDEIFAEISVPTVRLSDQHATSCLVKLGDTFPDLSLTTLESQPAMLSELLGDRISIVVFWSLYQPMSVEQMKHLETEFASRFRDAGVQVVAINVGDPLDEVSEFVADQNFSFPVLRDASGEAFQRVATGYLPRTYLLRADRTVVWFDLEYSRSSRRELKNGILYILKQFEQQANSGSSPLM